MTAFVGPGTLLEEMERLGTESIRAARQRAAKAPRAPKTPKRGTPERDGQRAVAAFLRKLGCIVAASVNEAPADASDPDKRARFYAARAKAGVQKGWPDLTVITPRGQVFWIEMKSARGKLSAAQAELHADMRARGCIVLVGRDVWSVQDAMEQAGIRLERGTGRAIPLREAGR